MSSAALDPPSSSSSDPPPPFRVAVVGGGLAGAAAASALAADAHSLVTLFDAGFRGVGGRASSRPLLRKPAGSEEAAANPTTDHGCQFVVDDGADARLTALLHKHATEWKDGEGKRFVSLDPETGRVVAKGDCDESELGENAGGGDFFGVLAEGSSVWVGSPTIDEIPRGLVRGGGASPSSSPIDVRVGWKVTAVAREEEGSEEQQRWRVSARPPAPYPPPLPPPPPQEAAVAVAAATQELFFDAVVLSDASALRAGSASAVAISPASLSSNSSCAPLEALARSRRAPLFSVAALLPISLNRDSIPFDVAVIQGFSDVSVVVRESAKPGRRSREEGESGSENEVWVAVSSWRAAAELLALAPPSKGAPPPEALEKAAERLWRAASEALQKAASASAASGAKELSIPAPLALRAQRWGAGLETNPAGSGSLFSLDEASMLAACGDAFGRGDAASALLSGVAAGEALLLAAAGKKKKKKRDTTNETNGAARSSL